MTEPMNSPVHSTGQTLIATPLRCRPAGLFSKLADFAGQPGSPLQRRWQSKRSLRRTAVVLLTLATVLNCTAQNAVVPPAREDTPPAESGQANSLYYYTESQLALKKADFDKAVFYLKKAVELDPSSIYLKRELAQLYVQQKDYDAALALTTEILSQHPEDIETLILSGRINQALNNMDQAAQTYETVLRLDGGRENIYLLLGGIYVQQERFDDAERVFNAQVAAFPRSYMGHFFLGKIYARNERFPAAEEQFKKALAIESSLLEPRFELLEIYRRQGRTELVVKTYQEILKENPGNVRAQLELGLVLWKQDRKTDARRIFVELGKRSQDDFEVVLKVIQTYLEPDRFEDAIVVVDGLLKGAPDSADLHHLAGVAYYGVKDSDRALSHFQRVAPASRFYQDAVIHQAFIYREKGDLARSVAVLEAGTANAPENAELYYYLGTFYEEQESYEAAERALKKAVELEPTEVKYHFRLGVVYDKWGNKDMSIETMKTVIRLDPSHANALNYLGYTYADLGLNLDEAERLIKEALKFKPNDGYITDSLGWVYYKKGQYEQALEILKKAVELVPDDPVILEHLGDVYLKTNDSENALKYYRLALQNNHKDREAIEEKIHRITQQQ